MKLTLVAYIVEESLNQKKVAMLRFYRRMVYIDIYCSVVFSWTTKHFITNLLSNYRILKCG